MSLSKKDKEWLTKQIRNAVKEELTVEWTIKKRRDEKTGQPLAKPETKTEKVFLPAIFVQLLPFYEGAMRGLHEDVSKNMNKVNKMHSKIDTIGRLIVHNEHVLKSLLDMKQLEMLENDQLKQIECIEADVVEKEE